MFENSDDFYLLKWHVGDKRHLVIHYLLDNPEQLANYLLTRFKEGIN